MPPLEARSCSRIRKVGADADRNVQSGTPITATARGADSAARPHIPDYDCQAAASDFAASFA